MKRKFYKAKTDAMFKKIFCDPKNKDLLERLLSEATGKKLEVIAVKSPELLKKNVYVKGKTMDVLVKTDEGEANIEINSYSNNYLHRRNLAYICNRYANGLEVGMGHQEMKNFIQINLTSETEKTLPPYEKYVLRGDISKQKYVNNLVIYEFNLPKLKDACYNKYRFISLLDAEEDELKKMCEGDRLMKKLESEVNRLNEDLEFVQLMTDEEENEALRKTYINQGYEQGVEHGIEQGIEQGEKNKTIDISKNMLKKGIDVDTISEVTNLSADEINDL